MAGYSAEVVRLLGDDHRLSQNNNPNELTWLTKRFSAWLCGLFLFLRVVIFDTFRNMIYKHFIGYFICGCCVLNLLIVATLESFFSPMESGQDPNVQFTVRRDRWTKCWKSRLANFYCVFEIEVVGYFSTLVMINFDNDEKKACEPKCDPIDPFNDRSMKIASLWILMSRFDRYGLPYVRGWVFCWLRNRYDYNYPLIIWRRV